MISMTESCGGTSCGPDVRISREWADAAQEWYWSFEVRPCKHRMVQVSGVRHSWSEAVREASKWVSKYGVAQDTTASAMQLPVAVSPALTDHDSFYLVTRCPDDPGDECAAHPLGIHAVTDITGTP